MTRYFEKICYVQNNASHTPFFRIMTQLHLSPALWRPAPHLNVGLAEFAEIVAPVAGHVDEPFAADGAEVCLHASHAAAVSQHSQHAHTLHDGGACPETRARADYQYQRPRGKTNTYQKPAKRKYSY